MILKFIGQIINWILELLTGRGNKAVEPRNWRDWQDLAADTAARYFYPDDLIILAMIMVESAGDPNASGDGGNARGLMQLQKIALKDIEQKTGKIYYFDDLYDPEICVDAGVNYLVILQKTYGLAEPFEHVGAYKAGVTAFNQGTGRPAAAIYYDKVLKWKSRIIQEMQG